MELTDSIVMKSLTNRSKYKDLISFVLLSLVQIYKLKSGYVDVILTWNDTLLVGRNNFKNRTGKIVKINSDYFFVKKRNKIFSHFFIALNMNKRNKSIKVNKKWLFQTFWRTMILILFIILSPCTSNVIIRKTFSRFFHAFYSKFFVTSSKQTTIKYTFNFSIQKKGS